MWQLTPRSGIRKPDSRLTAEVEPSTAGERVPGQLAEGDPSTNKGERKQRNRETKERQNEELLQYTLNRKN